MTRVAVALVSAAFAAVFACGGGVRAEVIDEIVAKVNDDIVTKSDLDSEEQGLVQELYRRYSGAELDREVATAKRELLRHLIDKRVLIQKAGHMFDLAKMQDFYLEQFKSQQNITSDKELERILSQQGMTLADLKKRLVDEFSPQQVVRAEVVERIAIPEKDIRAYYDDHRAEFAIPAQATVREIVVKAPESERTAKRAAAEAIRARAAAPGADFAAIAAEVSDAGTKKEGGLLGTVKRGDLASPLDKAAFTVPVGEVSPVIDADYGFHILKIDARIDEGFKTFDEVKSEIETKIQGGRFSDEYKNYIQKAWTEATIWVSPKYQDRLSPLK